MRSSHTRAISTTMILTLILSPTLAACGGGDDDADPTATSPAAAVTPTVATAATPTSAAPEASATTVASTATAAPEPTATTGELAFGKPSTSIKVGGAPWGVSVGAGSVWVANQADGTITRVDPETNEVVATIALEVSYDELAPDSTPLIVVASGDAVWVSESAMTPDEDGGLLFHIDPATNEAEAGLPVEAVYGAGYLIIDNDSVWMTAANAVNRYDLRTGELQASIEIPLADGVTEATSPNPLQITASVEGIWATAGGDPEKPGMLILIDAETNEIARTLPGDWALDIASTEGGLWVTNTFINQISQVDPETSETQTFELAFPVLIESGDGGLWVLGGDPGGALRIDPLTGEVLERFTTCECSPYIAVGEGAFWLTDNVNEVLLRIDPSS